MRPLPGRVADPLDELRDRHLDQTRRGNDCALEAAEEFVALYERLHVQLPQAFGDDLSGALRTLAELLHLW
jgi:hypothetical protein